MIGLVTALLEEFGVRGPWDAVPGVLGLVGFGVVICGCVRIYRGCGFLAGFGAYLCLKALVVAVIVAGVMVYAIVTGA